MPPPTTIEPGRAGSARRFCSSSEALIWRNEHAAPDAVVPFIECPRTLTSVFRLYGPLDPEALSAGVDSVVARHDVLRSVYPDSLECMILPPSPGVLRQVDLSGRPADCREAEAIRLVGECADRPFDLAAGPLFRSVLCRLANGDHLFAMLAHHVVFDGWSKRIFARELANAYCDAIGLPPRQRPSLAARYADYVTMRRERLASHEHAAHREFWSAQRDGTEDRRIPADLQSPGGDPAAGRHRFAVDEDVAAAMRALGRTERATVALVTLAVFMLAVHELADVEVASIGVPVADRPERRFEDVIGLLVNVLPVQSRRASAPDFRRFIGATRQAFDAAYEHRDLPYAELLDLTGDPDTRTRVPFRAVLNFVNVGPSTLRLPDVEATPVSVPVSTRSGADVSLHVVDRGFLDCTLIYRADRYSPRRAREIAECFTALARRRAL